VTSKRDIDINLDRAYSFSMARTAFTLRLDPKERAALESLSKIEKRPMNQLVNEAIKIYLSKPGRKEKRLQATLDSLQQYRKRDPEFELAKSEYIDAEASLGNDPLDGEIVEGKIVDGKIQETGRLQSKIRELLGA
jgi:hypothetical protein